MNIAILSESPADEMALRVLVEAVLREGAMRARAVARAVIDRARTASGLK